MIDRSAVTALCALARRDLQARAVSVAVTELDGLRYVAAAGVGADRIVDTLLPAGDGIAGFVAATGQSLSITRPLDDPRFARDVSERTGLVPTTIQCVPFHDHDGDVAGVLTIIDRDLADDAVSGSGRSPVDLAEFAAIASGLCVEGSTSALLARLDALDASRQAAALAAIEQILRLAEP